MNFLQQQIITNSILAKYYYFGYNGNDNLSDYILNIQKFFLGTTKFIKYQKRQELINTAKKYTIIWQSGSTRLLKYNVANDNYSPIFLMVPSLINKSYLLDLNDDKSLMLYLAQHGINQYLLDFGEPTTDELDFTLNDYITKRIREAVKIIYKLHGRKIIIGGYCMGGLLAMSATILYSRYINKLVLISTPCRLKRSFNNFFWQHCCRSYTKIPSYVISLAFAMADIDRVFTKYINFAKYDEYSNEFKHLAAVEYWLNDGISLTLNVYHDLINYFNSSDMYFKVASKKILPCKINQEVFIAQPIKDRIVPLALSLPLIEMIRYKQVVMPNTGHIGAIIGNRAKKELWEPMLSWLYQ